MPISAFYPIWYLFRSQKQQENDVGNVHQIYCDQIAISIWNKARNCPFHKTL